MSVIAEVGNTSIFLLAQSVDTACAFVIAIKGDSAATVPLNINSLKPLGMPHVCLHPSISPLSDLIEMCEVVELSSVLATFRALKGSRTFSTFEFEKSIKPNSNGDAVVIVGHCSPPHMPWQHLMRQLISFLGLQYI